MIELRKDATVLAVKAFIKAQGIDGKLTLCVKPKKDWRGKWWLYFSLKAGETVVADLPKMRLSKDDELNLDEVGIEFTGYN